MMVFHSILFSFIKNKNVTIMAEDKEKKIIKFLREKKGYEATSKIAKLTNTDYYKTIMILEDLERRGVVLKNQAKNIRYWKVLK